MCGRLTPAVKPRAPGCKLAAPKPTGYHPWAFLLVFAWIMTRPINLFGLFPGLPLVGLGSFAVQTSIVFWITLTPRLHTMSSTSLNAGVSIFRTLHRIHRQLTDLNERLDRGPRQIRAIEANVKCNEDALEKIRDEARTLRMATDQKQLQLKASEDKIKDLRNKLNAASTNREYQALLDQIAADEMTNSVLTDEILEALEESDTFVKDIAKVDDTLAVARQKAEETRVEVSRQAPLLQADVDRLEVELHGAESNLPADIRDLYKRVVRQKGEDALAVINNQCCGGCNQHVLLNDCSQIMIGQPVACKTCGRLLYLPE